MQLHFLWHMHQPSYVKDGIITMPWVFLHAIKDYYDMPYLSSKHAIKATFNVTASLIYQLELYANEGIQNDKFLHLLAKDIETLHPKEKAFVLKIIQKSAIKATHPRLRELLEVDYLSAKEMLDLEIFFLLSWCGVYLKEKDPVIQQLLGKTSFQPSDKARLLQTLEAFMKEILPLYKRLLHEEKISLFTTPFYHPILPLLLDMRVAKEANLHTRLPDDYMPLREDAIKQVKKSISLFKETFGRYPTGFWPAEGAVCENSLKIYQEMNLRYIATDEEILFKSLDGRNREAIYQMYQKKGVNIFFRDHHLSDLIGFEYRFWDATQASRDFIAKLPKEGVVSVILDGENAWEYYQKGGYDFLEALYIHLNHTAVECVRADDVTKVAPLQHLASGSWINGNFDTWVGHKQKNSAWHMLFDAKRHQSRLGVNDEKLHEHFLQTECSDWFWWYGDDHFSDFASEFDALFRQHIASIYQILGVDVPEEVYTPISDNQTYRFYTKPTSTITPKITGSFNGIFDWFGAGIVEENRLFSTMDKSKVITKIYYGFDKTHLFIALEGDIARLMNRASIHLSINERDYTLPIAQTFRDDYIYLASKDIIEIAIDKEIDNAKRYRIRIDIEDDHPIQTLPSFGSLIIDTANYMRNWFI